MAIVHSNVFLIVTHFLKVEVLPFSWKSNFYFSISFSLKGDHPPILPPGVIVISHYKPFQNCHATTLPGLINLRTNNTTLHFQKACI